MESKKILELKNSKNGCLYLNYKNKKIKTVIKTRKGKVVLEEGTLLRGIDYYWEEDLETIKKDGLIAPYFKEDNEELDETRENSNTICVFVVAKEQTLEEYYNAYNEMRVFAEEQYKGRNRICKEDGTIYAQGEETIFLPYKKLNDRQPDSQKIAFIINPTKEIKQFEINPLGRGYQNAYRMQVGIPKSLISGIMMSDFLIQSKNKIEIIKNAFPEQYIVSTNGDILYKPEKAICEEIIEFDNWLKNDKIPSQKEQKMIAEQWKQKIVKTKNRKEDTER